MLSKNYLQAALGLALLSGGANAQDLIISEVVDGTLPGGLPKFVELTNTSASAIDLSGFTIGNANNGNTTLGGGSSFALSGMLGAGESYVLSYEAGDSTGVGVFFDTYGCDPDNFDLGAFFNGDDVILLFLADGMGALGEALTDITGATIHDVYGDAGVDGTGTTWEYADSYVNRIGTTASATFVEADWNIAGVDALEAGCAGDDICEAMNHVTLTTPMPQGGCVPPMPGFTSFCFGDGGDQMGCTDCPCTNNAMVGSGGGCLHSGGTGSRLEASGSTSVSLDPASTADLRFQMVDGAAFQLYILNSGNAVAPGDPANPCFGLNSGAAGAAFDGLRCAIMGTLRNGGRGADANGEVGVNNNGWGGEFNPPGGIAQFFGYTAGSTKYFQCIHRDDPAVNCGTGLNTTQAVEVMFTM